MECKFYVGQVVAKNSDKPWHDTNHATVIHSGPDEGQAVKILGLRAFPDYKDIVYLELDEWPNRWFDHRDFSPIEDKKTDISMFTSILDKDWTQKERHYLNEIKHIDSVCELKKVITDIKVRNNDLRRLNEL